MMPSDTHKIDIYADKTPASEHVRRINAPTIEEVTFVILLDAVINDGNITNIGKLTILPSSYAGNPRLMHEAANMQQIALNPPATTLTAFFTLCQNNAFSKTLLYSEVPRY
ncbi:unnamed protein product [Onchocerca flexuosa]|uniref:Uncharacterized protein n=1 Tax=Onchocerca flexuosa TaxID=387005 RepID=A0A183I404_9BILA|nr:unnamed protein product [Onchocerca flexuosa]